MRSIFLERHGTALLVCLLTSSVMGQEGDTPRSKTQTSFYSVPLVCPAAPHIGCGSAAKPILLELERDPQVGQAWLNRAGTVIAVVWKEPVTGRQRLKTVQAALNGSKVREIKGEARQQMLTSFGSERGWYRAAAVDQLSQEEAGITAARVVKKMSQYISLTDAQAVALQAGFTTVLFRKLTADAPQDRTQTEQEILKVCEEHLEPNQISLLKQAHANGAFANVRDE